MVRLKLEGNEMWDSVPTKTNEELIKETNRKNFIISKIKEMVKNATFTCSCEDGTYKAELIDFENAMQEASVEDLEKVLSKEKKWLFYEDGCIEYEEGWGNKNFSLCAGRHDIPQAVDGAVFPMEIDPVNLQSIRTACHERLNGVQKINLYVTGLTVALVEVINYCHLHGVELTLWHYNRETGEYYPQEVY